jgi:hypothetical protein
MRDYLQLKLFVAQRNYTVARPHCSDPPRASGVAVIRLELKYRGDER